MIKMIGLFKLMVVISLISVAVPVWAEGQMVDGLQLSVPLDTKEDQMASIQRGAKFVAANCLSCHTLIYLRYDKVAEDAGINYDKMPINVKTWPYGVTPPDLSLEADVRGPDWIYTYLHSFYLDSSRPTGVNNLLVPDTAMPAILVPFQGKQVLVQHPMADLFHHYQWYDLVAQTQQGTMSPEEYDRTMTDVVNFLVYSAEPYQEEQHQIGYWVLAFLCILFVLMYLLKCEYWKDVKKHKDENKRNKK